MRLHVGVIGAEKGLGAIDRDLLDRVDDFASAVIALSRQTLGVLVRQRTAHRLEHGRRNKVLARDQLEPVGLSFDFLFDQACDVGVSFAKCRTGGATIPFMPAIHSVDSSRSIFSTRRTWRPPSNPVERNTSRIFPASSGDRKRDGRTSTFASL